MTSTKLMLLGILIMLVGFALDTATFRAITYSSLGADAGSSLFYVAAVIFVIGFVVGVIGFFRR